MRASSPGLLALVAVSCATGAPAPPRTVANPTPAAALDRTLLVDFEGLGLLEGERAEANTRVVEWARSNGFRVVNSERARRVLARARAGLDARSGAACGRPLSNWAGALRWRDLLRAEGRLRASVHCEARGVCTLELTALDEVGLLGHAQAEFTAPFDTALPWRDALVRALAGLAPAPAQPMGGLGIRGSGPPQNVRARRAELSWKTSAASAVDRHEPFRDAVSISSAGVSSIRGCLDVVEEAELLLAVDDLGRIAGCESRNADDTAASCACAALRSHATAAASIRGKRTFIHIRHRPADVVTTWGGLVEAFVNIYTERYTTPTGAQRFRAAVTDPSIAEWAPPTGGTLARCFADMPSTAARAVSVLVTFDGRGEAVSVAAASTPALTMPQEACVKSAFLRSRAACPSTPSSTARAVVHVGARPLPPTTAGAATQD